MDRINASSASFPINQALRAYAQAPRANRPGGAPYASGVAPVRRTPPAVTTNPTGPASPTRQSETAGRISPHPTVQKADAIGQLVGAKVQAINLSSDVATLQGPKPVATSAGTYTLYPQAADRNQAATGVALGRSLDLKG